MSMSGSRAHSPGPAYSAAVDARSPGSRAAAHAPTSSRPVSPSTPSSKRTPVSSGRAASSSYTSRERSAQAWASATGSIRYGHHSPPATTEVVRSTGSRVHSRTRLPRSARTTAVVSPITPPPTTTTSPSSSVSTPGR
ncbi:hypothetical protein STENM223S_04130 [Streptomyces tendae]